jgi:hypothetical protein
MKKKYQVSNVSYNTEYKVIGKHPDGRIFAVKQNTTSGLYVVDKNLNLVATLNTTLPNSGPGLNECRILSTGTMIVWGIYQMNPHVTKVYRSTDTTYTAFEVVKEFPTDICFIERSVDVDENDVLMCCEYTTVMRDAETGLYLEPVQLNIWRATNDCRDWGIVLVMNRNPQFEGDTEQIRHFHTVRYDKYAKKFWIGSGDSGVACKIWTINPDGSGLTKIAEGSTTDDGQFYRTTSFVFTEDYVFWGGDVASDTKRNFKKLDRKTGQITEMYLQNDCIRLSQKVETTSGELLIANKSFENSSRNVDQTTELFFYNDNYYGDWYSVYSWDTITYPAMVWQLVDNKDNRIFCFIKNIVDEDEVERTSVTAIIDIEKVDIREVVIYPFSSILKAGETKQFFALDESKNVVNSDCTWSLSDESVATIDANGVLTTADTGLVQIICTDTTNSVIAKTWVTIVSAESDYSAVLKVCLNDRMECFSVPVYDFSTSFAEQVLAIYTEDKKLCIPLTSSVQNNTPCICINTDDGQKFLRSFESNS